MRSRERKSKAVRLVLMGAAVGTTGLLAGCGGEDVQRNSYASLSDCMADYSEAQCRADRPVGSAGSYYSGSHLLYYGPWYHSNFGRGRAFAGDPGPGRFYSSGHSGFASAGTHGPSGTEGGHRGGFGSHGRVAARGS